MRKRRKTNKAQSLIAYSVLFCVVVAALLGMRTYMTRTLQEQYRQSADQFGQGEQYEKGETVETEMDPSVGSTIDPNEGYNPATSCELIDEKIEALRSKITELEATLVLVQETFENMQNRDDNVGLDINAELTRVKDRFQSELDVVNNEITVLDNYLDVMEDDIRKYEEFTKVLTGHFASWTEQLLTIQAVPVEDRPVAWPPLIGPLILSMEGQRMALDARIALNTPIPGQIDTSIGQIDALMVSMDQDADDFDDLADQRDLEADQLAAAGANADLVAAVRTEAERLREAADDLREQQVFFNDNVKGDKVDLQLYKSAIQANTVALQNGRTKIDGWITKLGQMLIFPYPDYSAAIMTGIASLNTAFSTQTTLDLATVRKVGDKMYGAYDRGTGFIFNIGGTDYGFCTPCSTPPTGTYQWSSLCDRSGYRDDNLILRRQALIKSIDTMQEQIDNINTQMNGNPDFFDLDTVMNDYGQQIADLETQINDLGLELNGYLNDPYYLSTCTGGP